MRYFLSGGTLLGAVRHQGYIPWDDDIDVFIVLKDWPAFAEAVSREPDFSFIHFMGEYDYYDHMALLCYEKTICAINHFPMQITSGVSIDIVPMIGLPDNENDIRIYAEELKNQYSRSQNTLYDTAICRKECQKLYEMMLKYDFDTSKYVGHILGPYYMKEVRPKEWFAKAVMLPFEGEEYAVPIGYDGCLKKLFGDYMQLPPEDKRTGHHFFKAYYK